MQFSANPAKADRLRQEAAELVDAFPLTLSALAELGYAEQPAPGLAPRAAGGLPRCPGQ